MKIGRHICCWPSREPNNGESGSESKKATRKERSNSKRPESQYLSNSPATKSLAAPSPALAPQSFSGAMRMQAPLEPPVPSSYLLLVRRRDKNNMKKTRLCKGGERSGARQPGCFSQWVVNDFTQNAKRNRARVPLVTPLSLREISIPSSNHQRHHHHHHQGGVRQKERAAVWITPTGRKINTCRNDLDRPFTTRIHRGHVTRRHP